MSLNSDAGLVSDYTGKSLNYLAEKLEGEFGITDPTAIANFETTVKHIFSYVVANMEVKGVEVYDVDAGSTWTQNNIGLVE